MVWQHLVNYTTLQQFSAQKLLPHLERESAIYHFTSNERLLRAACHFRKAFGTDI